ncbi:hypothetical protein RV12_GL000183 [Enterococcus quebecensis]|uniref:Peptidase M56 domain-containing protein n=2 Tax=Enterococcus quebecensis TaxID=903983 RepID=A0A1E5H2V9_9ENTE|nr:hypothetical protein BCR23_00720 [Enterococcus quebecensis]OJG75844.1 hypothetical protein RV12_GL000183 [Enterococcus quebecensis]
MGSKDTPFAPYIVYIWLAIAVCLIVQKITKYQSFAKYIKADWQSVDNPDVLDLLSEICEDKKITTPIDIYTTPLVSSPLLLGVRKNYIVLPHENMTQEQLYSILSHEITHYQNKDILYKWFMQFIVCIHWFNPVVYFIEKTMNRECEYACDEATTRYFSKEECYNYGTTLIEMTNNPGTYNEKVASVTLYENTKEIKNRLDAIITSQTHTQPKRSTALLSITVLMFSAIILGAYTPTPSKGTPDQNKLNESITNTSDSKPLGRPFS